MSAVRAGYKQTEVGLIPEDWNVAPLEDFTSFISYGFTNPMPTAESGIFMITAKDINRGKIQFNTARCTTEEAYRNLLTAKSRPKTDDLLLTKDGTLGRLALVDDRTVCINQSVAILRPNLKAAPSFLKVLLEAPAYQQRMIEDAGGSTIKHIYITIVNRMPVALPPTKAEQEAIAEALSDADALIESLEQLLAKKRHLKQGAMQELLTGKKRLPGFSGEWVERTFSEICWFQEGPGVRNTQFTATGVKLLNGTNIFRGVLNLDTTSRFISEREAYGPYAHFMADAGDIVIASSGITIERFHEKIAFVREGDLPFCMNTSTIRFKPATGVLEAGFLYHFLASNAFKQMIGGQATGSAQLNFGPSHVAKVVCQLPPVSEQAAIATILSDIDDEIAELESQLAKTRALKQGMMQKLLTGEIRLI